MDENAPQILALRAVKNRLDAVSPSFCLAKWLQVTLHLHRGLTHSCHHPYAHPIPLEEIAANAAALHNTSEKIEARRQMLEGVRPAECQYCWNIEDLGEGQLSDRVHKSQNDWALNSMGEILKDPLSAKIKPKYLEVSFSRACNFKCSYCSPAFSGRWAQEIRQSGPYPGLEKELSPGVLEEPPPEEENPYIRAFWEWWPEVKGSLHTFRITGGEPLLSSNTFKVLEMLDRDPAPGLTLSVNSNLGVPRERVEKLIGLVNKLLAEKKIAQFILFTSLEAMDARAEYIRHGLDTKVFWSNLDLVLQNAPRIPVTFMVTFNALSVGSFLPLLQKILSLRQAYSNEFHPCRIYADISYLRYPSYQAVNVLPTEFLAPVKEMVDFIAANRSNVIKKQWGFYAFELAKMSRIYDWMRQSQPLAKLRSDRIMFYRFFSEHDRRRGTDFLRTFPELASFWHECRRLALVSLHAPGEAPPPSP
jgi:organic radical activating enzyme